MRTRGVVASLLALVVAVGVPIAVAAPAQAGADPAVVSWSRIEISPNVSRCISSASIVSANPGSRITLHNDCIGATFYIRQGVTTVTQVTIAYKGQATISAPTTLGSYTIAASLAPIPPVSLIVTDTPINEPMAHDEFQQVGVPASGDCADVAPEVGHYPGYPIGGWSKSWAQWINNGTGGAVCTREVEQRPDGEIVLVG
jgi:hypothetical protein